MGSWVGRACLVGVCFDEVRWCGVGDRLMNDYVVASKQTRGGRSGLGKGARDVSQLAPYRLGGLGYGQNN